MAFKYDKLGFALSIQLGNTDFKAIITYNRENKTSSNYQIRMAIQKNGFDKIMVCDSFGIELPDENVNFALTRMVEDLYHQKKFAEYIRIYNYELKCFELGNTAVELGADIDNCEVRVVESDEE